MEKHWFKFYPERWSSDPKLRMCSLQARGLLIDLMSLAHADDGWLKEDPKTYQRLLMTHHKTFSSAWQELVINERISQCKTSGFWFIKRMVEDCRNYKEQQAFGRKGAAMRRSIEEAKTLQGSLEGSPKIEEEKEVEVEEESADDPFRKLV